MHLTSNPQRVRGDTNLGTVVPIPPVYRSVPQHLNDPKPKTNVDKDRVEFVYKLFETVNLSFES